ncbi:MAG: BON domain-containing protein [Hydrogenophaga sp.]|jgi:hyperosmotically inducible periplasmic protein|uniref:BON domain-containing protein n=1 Tax=Hydrogenophaga sp. TaxID=1904254 RepID=UPI0026310120|nr:BON domain-containing protein [Hydrogenophaga sp.]MCW5671678.1 BON domain-containing protein [Hydrogenophaga sp.]
MKRNTRLAALAAAAMATSLIVACGQKEDQTVGQRMDSTVEQSQAASAEMRADANNAAQDVKAAGNEAADKIAMGAADVAITAKVNAALAGDSQLSALKIDVDTTNGHVELKGTAPDPAARDRATVLAAAVEGVVKVENRLTVEAKG